MPNAASPLLTRAFALAWLASFAQGLALHSYVHLSGFLDALGANAVLIGWTFSTLAIAALVTRPFIGRAMDRHGRRGVILTGAVLHIVACAAYLTIERLGPWLFVVRALHGIAEAMIFSSLFTYAADIIPESRRTEGMALFGVSGLLPVAIAGVLGDLVIAPHGYRAFFALAVTFSVFGLLASLPLRDAPRESGGAPARGYWVTLLEPRLRPIWWMGAAFATSVSTLFIFLKAYVLQTGNGSVGSFFAAYTAAAIVLRLGFGWIPDRVGPIRALYPSILLLSAGLALLGVTTSVAGLVTAGVLAGFGHGFGFPILAGLVISRARASERGAAVSLFTALFHAGMLVGGPLFGVIAREFGYATTFWCAGAGLLLSTLGFIALERSPRLERERALES
ncbi:MAG: MFS transporter [Polyangiaceae bacterium]|nr:MFS transporter [Polyangiaceae bacterium]